MFFFFFFFFFFVLFFFFQFATEANVCKIEFYFKQSVDAYPIARCESLRNERNF